MVALVVTLFVDIDSILVLFIVVDLFLSFELITRLKPVFYIELVWDLGTEAGLCGAHFVELFCAFVSVLFLENLFLLLLLVVIFQLVDDFLLFLATLAIFEIVEVQLIFEIINVRVLFYVDVVESFKLLLQSFILLLIFRFYIFNALKSLVCTLQFNSASLNLVHQLTLILTQSLDCLFHLLHLACLCVDDVANAFLYVLLFSVRVQVATD